MHPPDKKPEPPSNTEAALAGCFVGSVGLVVVTVSLVVVTVIAVVVVASCPAGTASATEQREVRIELTRHYSGAVSVLLKGSGGWPAGEEESLQFETIAFGAAGTWGMARVEREVPVWQEGRSYRSSPVAVTLAVLRSPAGEFFVAVRGELLAVQFRKRERCGGACDTEWTGTFMVEAPEYVAPATPTPASTSARRTVPAGEARLTVTLQPSSTSAPGVEVYLESNHHVGRSSFQLLLGHHKAVMQDFIEPGEEYRLGWVQGRWERMPSPEVRTLHGPDIRHWACTETNRDYRLQFECSVDRTEELPDLTAVDEATLWYYIADEANWVRVYLRMGREWGSNAGVLVRFRNYQGTLAFCLRGSNPRVGTVEKLSCGGGVNSPFVTHANVSSVTGRAIHCQRHDTSDRGRSVWACEPW